MVLSFRVKIYGYGLQFVSRLGLTGSVGLGFMVDVSVGQLVLQ